MKYLLILFLSLFNLCVAAQQNDVMHILDQIKEKYTGVEDYQAKVHIHVDIDFLKMPDKRAKVFYKKPDKFRLKSTGFAMLPKKGVNFVPADFIQGRYTAISLGNTDGIELIKVIPLEDDSEFVLSTLWVDINKMRINSVEANTKKAGSYRIDIRYNNLPFDLPEQIIVTFDIKDFELPISLTGEFLKKEIKKAKEGDTKGSVTITYSDYQINQGIEDKIFEQRKKNRK